MALWKVVVSVSCLLAFTMVDKCLYTRKRTVSYAAQELNASAISRALATESLPYSPKSVSLLPQKLKAEQTIARNWETQQDITKNQRCHRRANA